MLIVVKYTINSHPYILNFSCAFIFHSASGLMKYKCTREIQNLWMLILRYIQLQIMHYINNILLKEEKIYIRQIMFNLWFSYVKFRLCLSSFPRIATRFNTHYQNAYANAFRNAFLELLRLSRVRVERKALSLRSCIAQFDPWSRDHVGRSPLRRSFGNIKAFQNNFAFIIYRNVFLAQTRIRSHFFSAFQKGVSNPLIKTALRLSSAKSTLKVVWKP